MTRRRAQMVPLSVQGMDVTGIAKVTFTSADRVREVINSFNAEGSTDDPRWHRQRATYKRTQGVRHLFGALDMNRDRLYGHMKTTKNRTKFLESCRYLCSLYPPEVRIAIVMGNYSPHLSTKKDTWAGEWA